MTAISWPCKEAGLPACCFQHVVQPQSTHSPYFSCHRLVAQWTKLIAISCETTEGQGLYSKDDSTNTLFSVHASRSALLTFFLFFFFFPQANTNITLNFPSSWADPPHPQSTLSHIAELSVVCRAGQLQLLLHGQIMETLQIPIAASCLLSTVMNNCSNLHQLRIRSVLTSSKMSQICFHP